MRPNPAGAPRPGRGRQRALLVEMLRGATRQRAKAALPGDTSMPEDHPEPPAFYAHLVYRDVPAAALF